MHRHSVTSSFVIALGLLSQSAACKDSGGRPDPDAGIDPLHQTEVKDIPLIPNRDLDLLFMIDNSASMADKQAHVVASFPGFIAALSQLPGGLPNLHIGVVTSDLGTKGTEDATAGPPIGAVGRGYCAGTGQAGALQTGGVITSGGMFLIDIQDPALSGARIRNYDGDLAAAFAQMATVGDGGCGFEQPLEAIKQALVPSHTANAGFLRPQATLAVILVTDEDDCSLTHSSLLTTATTTLGPQQSFRCTRYGVLCSDGGATTDAMNEVGPKSGCHPNDDSMYLTKVSDYAGFLKGLKSNPKDVLVAAFAAPADPVVIELRAPPNTTTQVPALAHSCTYVAGDGTTEVGDPGVRIKALLDQFPDRNVMTSICERDQSAGLLHITAALRTMAGDPCIHGKLTDVDAAAGLQPRCTVLAVTDPDSPARAEKVLPICTPEDATASNLPCWHIATDAASCPDSDHVRLTIEGQAMLPSAARVLASCVIDTPM